MLIRSKRDGDESPEPLYRFIREHREEALLAGLVLTYSVDSGHSFTTLRTYRVVSIDIKQLRNTGQSTTSFVLENGDVLSSKEFMTSVVLIALALQPGGSRKFKDEIEKILAQR